MNAEMEPQSGSNFLEKRVSRRSFLRGVATIGGAAFAYSAVGCSEVEKSPKEIPSATIPAELPKAEIKTKLGDVIEMEGFSLYLDENGLPQFIVKDDGIKQNFDFETVKNARETAIALGEPEVVGLFENKKTDEFSKEYAKKHPKLEALPEDVFTDEDLAEKGVKIVQADNTKLYIRHKAFGDSEPLGGISNAKRNLTIVLVDAPFLSQYAMRDEKYDSYRYIAPRTLKPDPIQFRNKQIDIGKENLAQIKDDPGWKNTSDSDKKTTLLSAKSFIFEYEHLTNDEELAYEEIGVASKQPAGLYLEDPVAPIILVATGGKILKRNIRVYFDENGKCNMDMYSYHKVGRGLEPSQRDSQLDPNMYPKDLNASCDDEDSYLYGAITSGFALRHELEHDKLISQNPVENRCEADTDREAMKRIIQAKRRFDETGDNSDYYFVFSLPEGGYILTSANHPNGQKAS